MPPSSENRLVRRWAKPAQIAEVREADDEVEVIAGRAYRGVEWTIGQEDFDRLREGRLCVQCMEPQETPFPEMCGVCRFPMREWQTKVFEARYRGDRHVGPTVDLHKEIDRLDAEHEEDKWREHPTLGIVVPKRSSGG